MELDIVIVAHFCGDFDNTNDRFSYLASLLDKYGFKVEIVTSNFLHSAKDQRRNTIKRNYRVTTVPEPGYSKNVSVKRVYSHYVMARNLHKYLLNRTKPDLIYCAVPSISVAKVAAQYAVENNIRFVVDIQDVWPEAFKMVFKVPIANDLLFYPVKKQADYIYAAADQIFAVSHTYLNRALKVNNKCKTGKSIFLGTDLQIIDQVPVSEINKPEGELWLAYVGTLGHSYDLEMVFSALSILKEKGVNNIKFFVMGDGPLQNVFKRKAQQVSLDVEFTGRLDYQKMIAILKICDIAINPIRRGSAGSIINKVADYAATGLPVLNTQECLEYRNLLEQYDAGINCNNGDAADVARGLLLLLKNKALREQMGQNNRRLAEERFDRSKTYHEIATLLSQESEIS